MIKDKNKILIVLSCFLVVLGVLAIVSFGFGAPIDAGIDVYRQYNKAQEEQELKEKELEEEEKAVQQKRTKSFNKPSYISEAAIIAATDKTNKEKESNKAKNSTNTQSVSDQKETTPSIKSESADSTTSNNLGSSIPGYDSDYMNLAIGDTAYFSEYSITIDSIEQVDGLLKVDVTMNANEKSVFANRYLTTIDYNNHEDKDIDHDNVSDVTVPAGSSHSVQLIFKDNGVGTLRWDNWSKEAEWNFTPDPTALAQAKAEEAEEKKLREEKSNLPYAWDAVEEYGEKEFSDGFSVHRFFGVLAEEKVGENKWHLKATCDVTNPYGTVLEDLTCEAYVTGSKQNWTVDSFEVY